MGNTWETLKHTLTNAPVLDYFDAHKQTVLSCDASPQGLGAVLAQIYPDGSERVIAYASRTLQAAEKNYSQTEFEGLSCVWAITHFHTRFASSKLVKPELLIFRNVVHPSIDDHLNHPMI